MIVSDVLSYIHRSIALLATHTSHLLLVILASELVRCIEVVRMGWGELRRYFHWAQEKHLYLLQYLPLQNFLAVQSHQQRQFYSSKPASWSMTSALPPFRIYSDVSQWNFFLVTAVPSCTFHKLYLFFYFTAGTLLPLVLKTIFSPWRLPFSHSSTWQALETHADQENRWVAAY